MNTWHRLQRFAEEKFDHYFGDVLSGLVLYLILDEIGRAYKRERSAWGEK